jgi:hypothetical protein
MGSRFIVIFLFLFVSSTAFAGTKEECINSLSELFSQYKGDRSKIDEFLKIQAGLTMHKLAYATLRNSRSKDEYRMEKEILKILGEVQDQYNDDAEFREVYDMFNHPDNKLSRSALSRVLPYIKDVINDQNDEQSAFKRKYFNIGLSDIRLLSILAEKEAQRSNGVYDHRLYRNHNHNNSILNFIKIINSSVKNTNWDKENMLKNFEHRIKQLQKQAIELLEEIDLPQECHEIYGLCKKSEDALEVIDENFLDLIGEALVKTDLDATLALRYDDVWLHTKTMIHGTRRGNRRNTYQTKDKERAPAYVPKEEEVVSFEESDKEVVTDYLVDHILDKVPYLFNREELTENPEFAVALAQAIDKGILAKSGENRKFIYNGHEYVLPELWNHEHSDLGLGRVGGKVSESFSWVFRIDSFDEDNTQIPSNIPTRLYEEFLDTMNEQFKTFEHKYSFEFNGKIYTYPDAKPLEKGIESFVKNYQVKATTQTVANSPLETEDLSDIAKEIREGNHSYVKDNQVYHISGARANLEREYARMKREYERTNTNVNEENEDEDFPELSQVKEASEFYPILTLKTITDRKRAFKGKNDYIDLFKETPITKNYAQTIIQNQRSLNGVSPRDLGALETDLVKENALAILNNDLTFKYKNENYYTATGKKVFPDANIRDENSSVIEGMVDHDVLNKRLIEINSQEDEPLILDYYARNLDSKCEYVSVVNKKDAALKVYKFVGGAKILVFSSPIVLGKEIGDQRTLYRDSNFSTTNNKSGAGEYSFAQDSDKRINLEHPSQEGPEQVVAMGLGASSLSDAEILLNPRQSNGNIEIPEPAQTYYKTNYVEKGCPFLVLPETDQLRYKVIEDELQLIPSTDFDHSQKTRGFHLSLSEDVRPKEIEIFVNDDRFKSEKTKEFLETLEDEKAKIMKDLNLTNDEYNELVKLAFGIMGTESNFGEGNSNFFGLWNSYKFKESGLGQLTVSMLKGEMKLVPIYPGSFLPVQTNPENNSRGNTQIKNVRDFLNESYPEIKSNNLDEPRNSAIATMYALKSKMDMLKRVEGNHSAITEENRMEYLYYMYLGSTNQITGGSATPSLNPKVQEANNYGDMLKIYTQP